jgi:hypothetical protein
MIDFAEKYGMIKFKEQEKKYAVPKDLEDLKVDLLAFAKSHDGSCRVSAVDIFKKDIYKNIRHKYLHLSAYPENGKSGHVAYIKDGASRDKNGNPDRKIFEG